MQSFKKIKYNQDTDTEQYIYVTLTKSPQTIMIPQNLYANTQKFIQFLGLDWQYIEEFDGIHQLNPQNPIYGYGKNDRQDPLYFRNEGGQGTAFFTQLSSSINIDWKAIVIKSSIGKSFTEEGAQSEIVMKAFKDDRLQNLTCMSFSYNGEVDSTQKYYIPPNEQQITIEGFIEQENVGGNITDIPGAFIQNPELQSDTWKREINLRPLFNPNWTDGYQMSIVNYSTWTTSQITNFQPAKPQPNFNRPCYIKIRISYIK